MESLDDKAELAEWLTADPALHLYEIGDLDPFFWSHTRWFGQRNVSGRVAAVALIYTGLDPPTVLAFERGGYEEGLRTAAAVPEPSGLVNLTITLVLAAVSSTHRRSRRF